MSPETAYLVLKAAQKLYGKTPADLLPEQQARAQEMAESQSHLEHCVLSSPEVGEVQVPDATLLSALNEIRGRYQDEEEFHDDLAQNGLSEHGLISALERELKVEAILAKVGTRAEAVTDMDVELYYQYHPDKFRRPETRLARHILITINDTIPENTRAVAFQRIRDIGYRVSKSPGRFAEQALKHSECPTALDGGKLGELTRGKLFAELDKALFELPAGTVSGVLESELGFHLLYCEQINAASVMEFAQAQVLIRKLLEKKRRKACQQAWLKALLKGGTDNQNADA